MTESEHETCTTIAEQLGKPYTPMAIGKLRASVCLPADLDGKYILPTGVLKIMAQIKGEIDIIEEAAPEIVTVKVIHHQTGNTRVIFAEDPDTRRKIRVSVPAKWKDIINMAGKRLKVNKVYSDGVAYYRYPAK
jgi:hypothetical protein